jgi:hypothetical protein
MRNRKKSLNIYRIEKWEFVIDRFKNYRFDGAKQSREAKSRKYSPAGKWTPVYMDKMKKNG